LGLTLEELYTRVSVEAAENESVSGPQERRAEKYMRTMREQFALPPVRLTIDRGIPEHVGLGSGTQLALAVGAALNELFDIGLSVRKIAAILDRGARSGIGVGAFEHGGFLVDGGKAEDEMPPPIVSRLPFPAAWRIMLIFDTSLEGLHGASEHEAFRSLPGFSEDLAGTLCRLTLMGVLPALADSRLNEFGRTIAEIQAVIGDYFAPAQGGRYTSQKVGEALRWLEEDGVKCIGQSSWGPTGFAVVDSDTAAYTLLKMLKSRREKDSPVRFMVCRARNCSAEMIVDRNVKTGAFAG
ncbi:MAG: beta-ribofuranosylaminobenzene 5'-phosphate synthase family protein, partial [Burkholderiales bacterium]